MQSVRLLQFSDTHLSGDAGAAIRGVATLPALKAAMRDAQRCFSHLDAVLLTGDLVQDDPAGYTWIKQSFQGSHVPVLCLPGNHDLPEPMAIALDAEPFRICGNHTFGRWLVVMLDSWVARQAGGELGAEQIAQLRVALTAHHNDHALICLHHHPLPMRSRWLDQVGLRDADAFTQAVRAFPNVRGVLWGHVHQALDAFVQGVRYMSTPATCAQFLPGSDDFALDTRPPGYRTLELMPDGTIVTEVRWVESVAA